MHVFFNQELYFWGLSLFEFCLVVNEFLHTSASLRKYGAAGRVLQVMPACAYELRLEIASLELLLLGTFVLLYHRLVAFEALVFQCLLVESRNLPIDVSLRVQSPMAITLGCHPICWVCVRLDISKVLAWWTDVQNTILFHKIHILFKFLMTLIVFQF